MIHDTSLHRFDHLNYGYHIVDVDKPILLTPDQCRVARETGKFHFDGISFDVAKHGTTIRTWFSEGRLDQNHYCTTSDFVRYDKLYSNSYEISIGKLVISAYKGTYNSNTGRVVWPSLNLVTNYMDQVKNDHVVGTLLWDVRTAHCHTKLSTVYNGTAYLYKHVRNRQVDPQVQDIIMVENDLLDRYAGFILKGRGRSCGVAVFNTQLPDIHILVVSEGDRMLEVPFQPQFSLHNTNFHTNIAFLHFGQAMFVERRFQTMTSLVCANERKALQTTLALVAQNNPYSLIGHYGEGHLISRQGSVAYLSRCVPKTGLLRSYSNCTQEVPVRVGDADLFADPLTLILQPLATVLRCDGITPVRWRMKDSEGNYRWVCANPAITPCLPPEQLQTSSDDADWHAPTGRFTIGAGKGVVSRDMLTQHEDAITSIITRPAINQRVEDALRGQLLSSGAHPGSLTFYGPKELQAITDIVGNQLIPFYRWVGEYWSTIMGVLVILSVVKILFGAMVRMYIGYRKRGCGWWILSYAVDSAFMVVTIPVRIIDAATKEVTGPLFGHRGGPGPQNRNRRPSGGDGAEGDPLKDNPREQPFGSSHDSSDDKSKPLAPARDDEEVPEATDQPSGSQSGPYQALTKKVRKYVGDLRFQHLSKQLEAMEARNRELSVQLSHLLSLRNGINLHDPTNPAGASNDTSARAPPSTIEEAATMDPTAPPTDPPTAKP